MKMKNRLAIAVTSWSLVIFPSYTSAAQAQETLPHFDMPVHAHENPVLTKWMLDRFEQRTSNGADQTYWEAQVWTGVDEHKLWLKTEGSRRHGITEDADLEAYYSRAVAAFWDTQIGMRHDFSVANTPSRNWLGVGFQGLAPYLFEVGATAYLGGNGRTAIRLKSQYDLLLTQNWVFMPEIELNAYGKADPERNLGSGVSDASLTLRVRYDIRRELSPYLGLMWTQKYADTADFARAAGEPVAETHYVAGIRAWW